MLAFVVTVQEGQADLAADVLWSLGVRAIEERSGAWPASGPRAGWSDAVELWTAVGQDAPSIERAVAALDGRWVHRLVDVPDGAAQTWREFAAPVWVDESVVVVPAWQVHERTDVDGCVDGGVDRDGALVVRIEPGEAFGLGDHPTTRASLRAVVQVGVAGADILDVGCGTGVIAVTAALLDARSVRAIDIAASAIEATEGNARRNGVQDRVVADTTPVAEVSGDHDVVVANILAPALVAMAGELQRLTRPTGRLIVSGILADAHDHVLAALSPMVVEETAVLDGWACVTLRH